MYEVWTCERIFPHMTAGQVFRAAVHEGLRPPLPADCPQRFAGIMQACWDPEPPNRQAERRRRALGAVSAWLSLALC